MASSPLAVIFGTVKSACTDSSLARAHAESNLSSLKREMFVKLAKALALGLSMGTAVVGNASAQLQFISIGTGGLTGVYYPTGDAICKQVNSGRKEHGIRCSAESTGGSIYNINTVRAGELEFGVAQSDWQYHAFNGTSKFEDQGAFEKLRAVFSVHSEPLTLLSREGSGIASFADLKGKRFNVGEPGSVQRATTQIVMQAFGLSMADFSAASELANADMIQSLCDDKIDAMTYSIGHPSAIIDEAANTCAVDFIEISGPAIDKLILENTFYSTAVIPAGMYTGLEKDVLTFGVGATIVTSADVPEDVVYIVVKSVFDNFEEFKQQHPAFAHLKEKEMISDGLSAPVHAGAVKYYKERGWM